jgi:hypothetical protein
MRCQPQTRIHRRSQLSHCDLRPQRLRGSTSLVDRRGCALADKANCPRQSGPSSTRVIRWVRAGSDIGHGRSGSNATRSFESVRSSRTLGSGWREARERVRLLYVGFTRAREHLVLAVPTNSKGEPTCSWLDELADAEGPLLELQRVGAANGSAKKPKAARGKASSGGDHRRCAADTRHHRSVTRGRSWRRASGPQELSWPQRATGNGRTKRSHTHRSCMHTSARCVPRARRWSRASFTSPWAGAWSSWRSPRSAGFPSPRRP